MPKSKAETSCELPDVYNENGSKQDKANSATHKVTVTFDVTVTFYHSFSALQKASLS
jgi:hypothetical protein